MRNQIIFQGIRGEVTVPSGVTLLGIGWSDQLSIRVNTAAYPKHVNIIVRCLGDIQKVGYYTIACTTEHRIPFFTLLLPNTPVPPEFGNYWPGAYGQYLAIYVPDGSVEAYKAAPGLQGYSGKILPMSEYHP